VSGNAAGVACAVLLTRAMSWGCLLDGALRRRAADAAERIIEIAVGEGRDGKGLREAGGRASLLFYGGREASAAEELDVLLAGVGSQSWGVGLWGGLAGIRFTVAHLAGGEEADEALAALDDALGRSVDVDVWNHDYDLIGGLAGIGVALLEGNRDDARTIAARVLDHLERNSQREPTGTTWYTSPELLPPWQREICPDGHFNFGLAHGIPGAIGFLSRLIDAGIEVDRAQALLDGATAWMRAAVPPRAPARFPSWRGRGAADEPARLAWCYGDPGVAITLLAAARTTGDAALEAEALAMGHAMAARPVETSGVRDAGICHGAAGVAHIFNRMYQATGDEVLGDAARGWIERLLAMADPMDGGVRDASVLMGTTGVGLVLLAATTEVEPAWDRAILCDILPGAVS